MGELCRGWLADTQYCLYFFSMFLSQLLSFLSFYLSLSLFSSVFWSKGEVECVWWWRWSFDPDWCSARPPTGKKQNWIPPNLFHIKIYFTFPPRLWSPCQWQFLTMPVYIPPLFWHTTFTLGQQSFWNDDEQLQIDANTLHADNLLELKQVETKSTNPDPFNVLWKLFLLESLWSFSLDWWHPPSPSLKLFLARLPLSPPYCSTAWSPT